MDRATSVCRGLRRSRALILWIVIVLGASLGCYTGSHVDPNRSPNRPGVAIEQTEPPPGLDASAPAKSGLPCDVAELLATSCGECHGAILGGGAQNRLSTYADLAAPSDSDPDKTVAERSLLRMKSTERPMPPEGVLPRDRVQILEKWVKGGLSQGQCGGGPARDGGGGALVDERPSTPPEAACMSRVIAADVLSPLMKPGQRCIQCHARERGPKLEIAGTVYGAPAEPNDCHGESGVDIVIIDANGESHTTTTNAAGNFTFLTSIPLPYRAMVQSGSTVRRMLSAQTDGDCNGCHSAGDSPGRILAR